MAGKVAPTTGCGSGTGVNAMERGGGGQRRRQGVTRRWWWAIGVVALGVLAFLAVRGPFRLVAALGVVIALLALTRPPAAPG